MYTTYKAVARNALIWFLRRYFPDRDQLVEASIRSSSTRTILLRGAVLGATHMENYRILIQKIREFNENIPPLINAYMNLSPDAGFRHGVEPRFRRCGGRRASW